MYYLPLEEPLQDTHLNVSYNRSYTYLPKQANTARAICGRDAKLRNKMQRSMLSSSSANLSSATAFKFKPSSRPLRRLVVGRVAAFKDTEKIADWRIKQMTDIATLYFTEFLTKGRAEVADQLFDEDCVHIDKVWDPTHPTVGPRVRPL
jgi:hypothetical protein